MPTGPQKRSPAEQDEERTNTENSFSTRCSEQSTSEVAQLRSSVEALHAKLDILLKLGNLHVEHVASGSQLE